jgi:hypothetical protein
VEIRQVAGGLELTGDLGRGRRHHATHGEIERATVVQAGVDESQCGVRNAGAPSGIGGHCQRRQIVGAGRVRTCISDRLPDSLQVLLHTGGILLCQCAAVNTGQLRDDQFGLPGRHHDQHRLPAADRSGYLTLQALVQRGGGRVSVRANDQHHAPRGAAARECHGVHADHVRQ